MQKAFPSHLDPKNFTVSDFKGNEYDAYFWFGYYSGLSGQEVKKAAPVEEVADVRRVSKPLCEEAEYVALDTETSGLSGNDAAIQVAVVFCRKDGSVMGTYNKLWKLPEGKRVTSASTKIHGITNRKLQEEGVDARPELAKLEHIFSRMLARGKRLVAHNSGCAMSHTCPLCFTPTCSPRIASAQVRLSHAPPDCFLARIRHLVVGPHRLLLHHEGQQAGVQARV